MDIFAAMGNDKRLLVLSNLATGDEISVNELAKRVGLKQNALSHHLAILRQLGLVTIRREQQTIYYACDPAVSKHITHIIETALVVISGGKDLSQPELDARDTLIKH